MMKKNKRGAKKKSLRRRPEVFIEQDEVFSRYPPECFSPTWPGALGRPPVPILKKKFVENHAEECAWLDIFADNYKKTGGPIHILDAILTSHRIGYYPPVWAQAAMADLFTRYFTRQGQESLDTLFGFSIGSGGYSFHKQKILDRHRGVLMDLIFRLTLLEVKTDTAIELVHSLPGNKHGYRVGSIIVEPISLSTMRKLWYAWRKVNNDKNKYHVMYKESVTEWLSKNQTKFLSQFPYQDLPLDIRVTLKPDLK